MIDRKLLALTPDPELPQPIAAQFFQKLKIAVTAGYWLPSDNLPSAANLAEALSLPTAAIEQAYQTLCSEHWLIESEKGYQITPKIDQPVSRLTSLSDMLRARGFSAGSVWIKRGLVEPDLQEQCRLHLQSDVKVARLERLRTANDVVIGYECSTLPESFLPDPNKVGPSLYRYMTDNNLNIARAAEEIDAFSCDEHMAKITGFELGKALLRLTRVSYMANGRALELTYSYFRSDYYRYVVELND